MLWLVGVYSALQWGQRLSALDTNGIVKGMSFRFKLQWGQRLSALDTGELRFVFDSQADNASMGPTPFSVGYQRVDQLLQAIDDALQWGQRLSALDTAFSPRFSLIVPLFGGECRHFACGSFFWMPNRDGFRPSEPIFARFLRTPLLGRFAAGAFAAPFGRFRGFHARGRRGLFGCQGTARAAFGRGGRYSANLSSGQRGISDSWTPKTSSASARIC